MTYEDFCTRLKGVTGSGDKRTARCPAHDDVHNSLSVAKGDNGGILLKCHAGCEIDKIVGSMGLEVADIMPESRPAQYSMPGKKHEVARYQYPGCVKIRYSDKSFAWYQPEKKVWKKHPGVTLYNPEALKSGRIFAVEGEKDVDTLKRLGKAAVCGPNGAGPGKWPKEANKLFAGKHVVVLGDHDDVGRAYAIETAENLLGTAKTVKLIDLSTIWPEVPHHGDITDYLEAGGDLARVDAHVNRMAPYVSLEAPSTLRVKRMAEVLPKRAQYLFYPYLPRGKLSIIAGVSGATKTWIILYLAALVSIGGGFITDDPWTKREPGIVIYQTKENDLETDIRPRLDKLKADLDKIIFIDEHKEDGNDFPLSLTDGRIEETARAYKPSLIIFDPVQSFIGASVDFHRANEVRPILDKLIDIAATYDCAVVLVSHMSKQTTAGALDRILGSSDLRNAARSICIIGSDPDDPERRVLAHAKNSLGIQGQSIAYHIDDEYGVVIDGFCDLDEDSIVQPSKSQTRDKSSANRDEAVVLLNDALGEEGFAKLDDIMTTAKKKGVSRSTLYRARDDLHLKSLSLGFGNKTTWWMCPDADPERLTAGIDEIEQTEIP